MKLLVPDVRFSTGYRHLTPGEEILLRGLMADAMGRWPSDIVWELVATLGFEDLSNE